MRGIRGLTGIRLELTNRLGMIAQQLLNGPVVGTKITAQSLDAIYGAGILAIKNGKIVPVPSAY